MKVLFWLIIFFEYWHFCFLDVELSSAVNNWIIFVVVVLKFLKKSDGSRPYSKNYKILHWKSIIILQSLLKI